MSRHHASSLEASSTRTAGLSAARARSYCAAEASIVTGSLTVMASATAVNASWAGPASSRPLSGRCGPTMYCLFYTSDAAADLPCVELGGLPTLKKNNN